MIINMRVPDEAVKEMGVLLRDYFYCKCIGDCEICDDVLGCECLVALREACCDSDNIGFSNYVCEVTFNEE